jgi:hypothetical protein
MSQNGVIIRLPEERWQHITERHQDLTDKKELVLNTITEPDYIFDVDPLPRLKARGIRDSSRSCRTSPSYTS